MIIRTKRITVSLPDELVAEVRRAAGGERQFSAYVARAFVDFGERESLEAVLASWDLETPVPDEVRRLVAAELDQVGLNGPSGNESRQAG
jgi:hypothetical protein